MSSGLLDTLLDHVWSDGLMGLQQPSNATSEAEVPVRAIVDEYLQEYEAAIMFAAVQIWASMHRHNGDPRWAWEYTSGAPLEVVT